MIAWIEKHRDELRRHILLVKMSNPIHQVGSDSTVDIRTDDLSRNRSAMLQRLALKVASL